MAEEQQDSMSLGSRGIISREQLLGFFDSMSAVLQQPEVKQRLAVATRAGEDAVATSTGIQREVFLQMGIEPQIGLGSLANVQDVYQDDRECIIKYLKFVESEDFAREEAALGQYAFQEKMKQVKEVQEQQLKLLHQLRNLPADVQEGFLQGLQEKLQSVANDDVEKVLDFYRAERQGLEDSYQMS